MSQNPSGSGPEVVNLKDLLAKLDALTEAVKASTAAIPPAKAKSLNENVGGGEKAYDYRPKLLEMMKGKQNFIWQGEHVEEEKRLFETIGAVSGGSAIPQIWAADVWRCCPYPNSAFLGAPYIEWHEDVHGKPGDTINIVTVGAAIGGTAGCAEPASTAPTVSALALTLEEYQCSHYICRNDMEDMIPDTVTKLNDSLATCIDNLVDNAFIANMANKSGVGTLIKTSGTMSAAIIAEAIGSMRSGTCKPVALIMHSVPYSSLLLDSSFTNAATFGDRSVITTGDIANYLGINIIALPLGSLKGTTGAVGSYSSILLAQGAVHGAMKRDPVVESQYLVQTQRQYIYASVRFGKRVMCTAGILWIETLK